MGKVKTTCAVQVYGDTDKLPLKVHSHWNQRELIELQVGEQRIVVAGDDLKRAVDNCMNVGR